MQNIYINIEFWYKQEQIDFLPSTNGVSPEDAAEGWYIADAVYTKITDFDFDEDGNLFLDCCSGCHYSGFCLVYL